MCPGALSDRGKSITSWVTGKKGHDHALIEVLLISWIDLAFMMWGTCMWTGSPPLPFIWDCRVEMEPKSVDPTCPVCLKFIGCPIWDLSIRGRLGCGSCSATHDPKSWIQNSPAITCPVVSFVLSEQNPLEITSCLCDCLVTSTSHMQCNCRDDNLQMRYLKFSAAPETEA